MKRSSRGIKKKSASKTRAAGVLIFLLGLLTGVLLTSLFTRSGGSVGARKIDPRPVNQILGEAATAFLAKDYLKAKDLYEAVLAKDPVNYDANKFLATVVGSSIDPPDYAKAVDLARTALKVKKEHQELAYYGRMLWLNKQYAESESVLRECLKMEPKDPYVTEQLGYVLQMQGKKTEALKTYRKALQLKPNSASVMAAIAALEKTP
jgi:Flp pilus assembly protein TadD